MTKIKDIERWREEISQAEKFREDEFGKLESDAKEKAGENIEYYEYGFSDHTFLNQNRDMLTTLNIIDAITSIVVPSLYFRNPRTVVTPKRVESEDTAPLVARTLDHFRKQLGVEEVNQKIIWDAYVLGYGVYKVGYTTKFGMDIPDKEKEQERKKPKSIVERGLEVIGLKEKEKEEVRRPEMDLRIVSESPFITYVNPFDFGIDPRASSINDAMFVYHKVRKTVKELKENKKYKNTGNMDGNEPDIRTLDFTKISGTEQEAFKTRDLYEIHYRNDDKFYMLVISTKDGNAFEEHYHEESAYDLGEWQFGVLNFKNHGHSLYPRSDITKIKPLQDRLTSTIDSILDQVDKFVPKLAYSDGDLSEGAEHSLKNGTVGALVKTNKNPNEVFKELQFTQLKADLQALIDQLISLISVQTGITRAQITGLSSSGTATEATIEQGGQTLRLSDMSGKVQRMVNEQSRKLWKVVRQFTPLEDLELINGIRGINLDGSPKYDWLTLNDSQVTKVQEGEYDFDIEVGSTEKINLSTVRKSFENLFSILARTEVIALMQQQGDKVVLSEILRKYADLFPELGIDASKFIQKISQDTQGLVQLPQGPGGTTQGSQFNALEKQFNEPVPSFPQELSEAGQR